MVFFTRAMNWSATAVDAVVVAECEVHHGADGDESSPVFVGDDHGLLDAHMQFGR